MPELYASQYTHEEPWETEISSVRLTEPGQLRREEVVYELSTDNIPKYVKMTKKRLTSVPIGKATHVFATTRKTSLPGSVNAYKTNLTIGRDNVSVLYVKISNTEVAVYIKTTTWAPGLSARLKAWLAAAFADNYVHYYTQPESEVSLKEKLMAGLERWVSKKEKPLDTEERRQLIEVQTLKLTQFHHLHYNVKEVIRALPNSTRKKEILIVMFRLSKIEGSHQAFLAGVGLWLASLSDNEFEAVLRSKLLRVRSLSEFAKLGKRISVQAKSVQGIVSHDMRKLFEIDVLVNRGVGSLDWEQERENRVHPDVVQIDVSKIYANAKKVFLDSLAEGRTIIQHSEWSDYWATRWQHVPNGAIHSQYVEDKEYISKEREFKNKFITLNSMSDKQELWLEREPQIRAWASYKYEWGKERAIYGTDLTSFVNASFGFWKCEESLPWYFPVGAKASEAYVRRSAQYTLHARQPFCFDFEDFNSQHSSEGMQAVIKAYRDTYGPLLTDEQVKAIDWTMHAFSDMAIKNSFTDQTYRANGTLMSGHRLTTFLNSVLNRAYLEECVPAGTTAIHNGDDALIGVTSLDDAITLLNRAEQKGVRCQREKCFLFGMSEFLRVDHNLEGNGQYLTRAIATLVHGRMESNEPVQFAESIRSNETRLEEAWERGLVRSIGALRMTYAQRVSKLYSTHTSAYMDVLTAHAVVGGLSEREDASVDKSYTVAPSKKAKVELDLKLPGVADFAGVLAAQIGMTDKVDEIAKRIYKNTVQTGDYVRKKLIIEETENIREAKMMRALYKAFVRLRKSGLIGQARLAGFSIECVKHTSSYIGLKSFLGGMVDANEQMRWLSVVV